LLLPGGNWRFTLEALETRRGEAVSAAPGSGHIVRLPVPGAPLDPAQVEFALLVRDLVPPNGNHLSSTW
ncbi:MAG: U32 family peptidase C-terminal domain-containing protein, partial [Halomonas sp.]|nr:U32 family peptidase C-terminal domain-containing protein [Halomonas sp.]